ncbi:hypothetical protein [Streptomyces sp. LN549]|uniref:hypothetical protein n=1 Tax=Streptomyces sp. LN549 TaxID=3112979 RepID=UPI0037151C33
MDITAWVWVPVAAMLVAATAAVLIVAIALRGTESSDRAIVIKAVAELIRAVRGRRR